MKFIENYSLKNLNTFGVEVNTKLFVEINSKEELIQLISTDEFKKDDRFILGGGSNILFTKDYNGLVIKNNIGGISNIEENDDFVILKSGAGVIWDDLVKYCVEKEYWGIENLSLIPGTVGAVPIQNIGAYGTEIVDVFESLTAIDLNTKEEKTFVKDECNFSYRNSVFKNIYKNKFCIVDVSLKLSKKYNSNLTYKALSEYLKSKNILNPSIKDISNSIREIRQSKLPDPEKIGNAGSFFKNPVINKKDFEETFSKLDNIVYFIVSENEVKIPAAWLIENSGLKGFNKGNVGTYKHQPLVLINKSNATGKELYDFSQFIIEEVKTKFGIELEREVNII